MDKEELLRTITSAYDELSSLLQRISDKRLRERAMDQWTGKDVLAHLAWWQDHSALLTGDCYAGRRPDEKTHPAGTTDEVNETVFREHIGDSPQSARQSFAQSFQRLLAALEPVGDDDLFNAGRCSWLGGGALSEMILSDTSRHYAQHFPHLDALSNP